MENVRKAREERLSSRSIHQTVLQLRVSPVGGGVGQPVKGMVGGRCGTWEVKEGGWL